MRTMKALKRWIGSQPRYARSLAPQPCRQQDVRMKASGQDLQQETSLGDALGAGVPSWPWSCRIC